MLASFTEGFFLGLGAAIPLGPINILIMNLALKSYKSGVALGLGAMSADVTYLLLVSVGIIGFLTNPVLIQFIGIFGSLFLFFLAYSIYKSKDDLEKNKVDDVSVKKLLHAYVKGFLLTLLNPMTIVFWLSIAGYIANKELQITYAVFGLMTSIGLWITIMPLMVHRSKHRISRNASRYINIVSSLILFGFAISLFLDTVFL